MSMEMNNDGLPLHGTEHEGVNPLLLRQRFVRFYHRNRDGVVAYSLLTPVLIYFAIFSVFPVLFVIYLSFTEWNGIMGFPQWIGIRNFRTFFTKSDYVMTLVRAGIYGFIILFLNMIIGFLTALLLNMKIKGASVIRTIWYLPVIVPFSVVAQMVSIILNPVDGVVKNIMLLFTDKPVIFQQSAYWMSFWIIIICVWKGVGHTVIIYLAGLQNIDTSLYEAAQVDGANSFRIFRNVTLPCLRPITMFVLITGTINSFLIFEPVQLITQGGPHGETNTILFRIFQDAFKNFDMGMAGASSVIVLVITLILSINQYRISQRSIV